MSSIKVTIDARPQVWGDASEFVDAPERGRAPRSKIIAGKEHLPDELVPENQRASLHHRDWRHIQEHTTPGSVYTVYCVHGHFVEGVHAGSTKKQAHFESWFLVVEDGGHFLDVPASICEPVE